MAALTTLSEHACFGGVQRFFQHSSQVIGLPMKFGLYTPPQATYQKVPVVFFLAGLTCNEETFAIKAGAQRMAAELGIMLVMPDTSPRQTGVAGADESWDLGHGAGFYVDATQVPWSKHWCMESYITQELYALIMAQFPAHTDRVGLMGHSMGGHGALTLGLKHPDLFHSVSAIAPITAPMRCPWGTKAFKAYLGEHPEHWAQHDATALLVDGLRLPPLLVDQGLADQFLAVQLQPHLLEQVCQDVGQALELRRHALYDHGYYFVASVIADHLRHHTKIWRR
jgi:S-formylglutathione hydrolase